MTEWDGRGLPPAAAARMERFAAHSVRSSFLSVPAATGIAGAGLEPVGDVMGCRVQYLGWQGWGGCGYGYGYGYGGGGPRTVVSRAGTTLGGFRPYVDAVYQGYDGAIARMVAEAQAMGADGVVGVQVSADGMGPNTREFLVRGSAVRARTQAHPRVPFVTDLSGADVLALMRSGWVPVSLAIGVSVAVRHDDYVTQQQATLWAGNVEVSGYTELVHRVREDARQRFGRRAATSGADGALVSSMRLHVHALEVGEGHRDHVAEAVIVGSTIAQFERRPAAPVGALAILPLREMTGRGTG